MNMDQLLRQQPAVHALVSILIELICITLAWYALAGAETGYSETTGPEAPRAGCCRSCWLSPSDICLRDFAIDYWDWSKLLKGLVE